MLERVPGFTSRMEWFLEQPPGPARTWSPTGTSPGRQERRLLSLLRGIG
jgi:hypothetical protein